MLRKILLPGSPILAAVAVVTSENSAEKKSEKSLVCKPSDLPIYSNPLASEKPLSEKGHQQSKTTESIEKGIRSVRVEISKAVHSVTSQKEEIEKYYEDAILQTKFIQDYLQEEDNSLPRVGAIVVGGLSGIILGIRGGVFRKLLYGSVVSTGVATICYPREAKKYASVAYNFAYGIKPGDSRQKDLPQFPKTMDELKAMVLDFSKSVFPSKK